MENYVPPYEINDEMLDLVARITEKLGQLNGVSALEKLPKLRRISRISSIHSTLAIENNKLSVGQVTDVIDGKRVLGFQEDVLAVKNAISAYKLLKDIDPYSIDDLLKVHGVMMQGLVSEAGKIRTGQVGVYNGEGEVIHIAPSAEMVSPLIYRLLDWAKTSKANMLIKSSIFHYEFEFIHPFRDGNGRMGRLWQSVMLSCWKPIFEWIPIESIIKENQQEYYKAIALSTSQGRSDKFILFMLSVIDKAIQHIIVDTQNHINHISNQVAALMGVIESYPQSASELMAKLDLKSKDNFRKNYLYPAIESGLIEMTDKNKPTSRNQRYFKI